MTRRLSIFDLLVITLVAAVHIIHFPLAVSYPDSSILYLVWLIPTLITVWIHVRVRPTAAQSIFLHYFVSVYWAFLYGYGYALAANAILEHVTPFEPARYAVGATKEMAFIAIFSSLLYGATAYGIQLTARAFRSAGGS